MPRATGAAYLTLHGAASPHVALSQGLHHLYAVTSQGLRELVFSQGLSPDLCSYDGRTAMHCAAARKHLGALRFLLQARGRAMG